MSPPDTCSPMERLDAEVVPRLAHLVVAILRLARYIPLDAVVALNIFAFIIDHRKSNGCLLVGERWSYGPVWVPETLIREVRLAARYRKRPTVGEPRAPLAWDDSTRMFRRGTWLHRAITPQEIFGIIVRAVKAKD